YAQTTVNLSSPGTLKNVADITSVTDLILTGSIDARDVAFICDNFYPVREMLPYSFYNVNPKIS
ncbi:MAG: hypothetical protein LBG15_12700, partial [Dysgonamonadaceae bacterium]|nr:hypothetical protein [Dysgonamonadaceae bacterium]